MADGASRRFRVVQEMRVDGETTVMEGDAAVARFSFGEWKREGAIWFEEGNYEVIRQGRLGGVLRLERDGVMLTETRIVGGWGKRAELSVEGIRYEVVWPAVDAKTVLRRNGGEVGFVGKSLAWRRETEATFFWSVPPMVCMFVMWLSTYKRRMDKAG